MKYSCETLINIFSQNYNQAFRSENKLPIENNEQEKIENLRHKNKGVLLYRVKTIKSGEVLESEIFPIFNHKRDISRAKREGETSKSQKGLNDKNARKNLVRKVNTNFTKEDLSITLTYSGKPPNQSQALKDIQNYIRRIKNYRKKNDLPDIKYIYVIEYSEEENTKKRIHHHVIMSNMDRDVAESLWKLGRANCDRLKPDEFGFEGLVRYMVKDPKGNKRYCCSKNLKEPSITVSDHKFSKRKLEKIMRDENNAKDLFENTYEGYIFNDVEVKYNDLVPGAYIYARMRVSEHYKKANDKRKLRRLE